MPDKHEIDMKDRSMCHTPLAAVLATTTTVPPLPPPSPSSPPTPSSISSSAPVHHHHHHLNSPHNQQQQQQQWLIEMEESEGALQRQAELGARTSNTILKKCSGKMDAVAQWFARYGGSRIPRTAYGRSGDQLIAFLAVVSMFEACTILYLLKAYESCM